MADDTPDFWERAQVKDALAAVPEGQRAVFRALIESTGGDKHHDAAGTHVLSELARGLEALARLSPSAPPPDDKPAPGLLEGAQRDKHIRETIEARHGVPGKRMMAIDVLKYWESTAASLGYRDSPARDPIAGKVDHAPGSVDKLIAASRATPAKPAKPVDPALIVPQLPPRTQVDPRTVGAKGPPVAVRDPLARLRLANALRSDSTISQAVREFTNARIGFRVAPTAELQAIAQERMNTAAARIVALGYKVPPS